MPIDEVYARLGKQKARWTELHSEGFSSSALTVPCENQPKSPCLVLELENNQGRTWTIYRIQITDLRYATAKGIHVGSTLAEISAAYPDREIISGEGEVVAALESKGISFQLDADDADHVPKQAKVICILVFAAMGH